MAERLVACGWIAASVAGLITLVFLIVGGLGLTPLNLIDAVLLLGLAYGIYRRSRVCAVLVLAYHVANQMALFERALLVPPLTVAIALVFGALYVLGIIGTFSHHARRGAQAA